MQKQHTKIFQELVDETNARLKKVENEFNEQLAINVLLFIPLNIYLNIYIKVKNILRIKLFWSLRIKINC